MKKNKSLVQISYFLEVPHLGCQDVDEVFKATTVDETGGLFRMKSVTTWGVPLAPGDLFFAAYDEDFEMLNYRGTLERSGNSLVQIINQGGVADFTIFKMQFELLGCKCTTLFNCHMCIAVPKERNFRAVKQLAESLCEENECRYREILLSDRHRHQSPCC